MNNLFFVVMIVAIVFTAGTIQQYFKLQREKQEYGGNLDEFDQRVAELEERIRVLERIVTENKYDLKQEINRL